MHHVSSSVLGQTKKSRTFQTAKKPHILGDKCPGGKERQTGKGGNLQHLNGNFCSLCPFYNKLNLADKKFPSYTDATTLPSKAK